MRRWILLAALLVALSLIGLLQWLGRQPLEAPSSPVQNEVVSRRPTTRIQRRVRSHGFPGDRHAWRPPQTTPAPLPGACSKQGQLAARPLTRQKVLPLAGRNLVIAGDSNDRKFMDVLCRLLANKSDYDDKTYIEKLDVSEHGNEYRGQLTWARDAQPVLCHDEKRNASAVLLFHSGLWSIPPVPDFFRDFAKRRLATHGIGINGRARSVPATDLGSFVWPHVLLQSLPRRPLIVLMQSSIWDAFPVLEHVVGKRVSQLRDADLQNVLEAQVSAANLSEWRWLERASFFVSSFVEGISRHGLQLDKVLWRTNPNCPAELKEGASFANAMTEAQSQAVHQAVALASAESPWVNISVVDWRARCDITAPSQCDKHHFKKGGYVAYLEALRDFVDV